MKRKSNTSNVLQETIINDELMDPNGCCDDYIEKFRIAHLWSEMSSEYEKTHTNKSTINHTGRKNRHRMG